MPKLIATILEIGPGIGNLTQVTQGAAERVLPSGVIGSLKVFERLTKAYPHLELIWGDA